MGEHTDVLVLLAERTQLIQQLSKGNTSTRSLTQILPASRSTVTRALNTLETKGLVQRSGTGYELTRYGRFAFQIYRQVINRYETLTVAQPLLHHLSESSAIPSVVFDDATVIRPTPPTPDAPRTRFLDCVRQAETVVGISNVITQRLVEVFHEQLTAHDLQLSLLLNDQVVEQLRYAHPHTLDTALQMDHCTLHSLEQTPSFSLTIIDWTVLWLGVYNERGQLQGMLQTESSAAIEWAKQRLKQYAERARPICPQEQSLEQRDGS